MANLYAFRGARCRAGLAALLLGLAGRGAAQTAPVDTTRLKYGEEVVPAPLAVAPLPRQERDQWRLGLNNFLLNGYPFSTTRELPAYYTRYGVHLAYERWLARPWSVQAELSPAVTHYRRDGDQGIRTSLHVRAQVLGRYYYNLERRRRLGHRTNGFSGSYLGLALGTGLGGPVRETPFYLLAHDPGPLADAALLWGWQVRLGRYVSLDYNLGISALLSNGLRDMGLASSLRVGLALPGLASDAVEDALPYEANALLPRFFAGVQAGESNYWVHYAGSNPYPADYTVTLPNEHRYEGYNGANSGNSNSYAVGAAMHTSHPAIYAYAGYYLLPRLAVQAGVQVAPDPLRMNTVGWTYIDAAGRPPYTLYNHQLDQLDLAVPVQLRYALVRAFWRRFQLEVVGGFTPVWSTAHFRSYRITNGELTDEVNWEFRRTTLGLHAQVGYGWSLGLGRRRRLQVTFENMYVQDLHDLLGNRKELTTNVSLGLRYRFGYR